MSLSPSTPTGPARHVGGLLVALAAALVLDRLALWRAFAVRWADDDSVITWLAAREFARGAFHEPAFWGQPYNTLVESLLAVPGVWLGLSPAVVTPLATTGLAVLPFLALAACAWRAGAMGTAAVLLGLPLLLPLEHGLVAARAGFLHGTALTALALAWWWLAPARPGRTLTLALAAGVGVVWLPSTALLAVPVGLYVLAREGRSRRTWAEGVAGLALAAGVGWTIQRFYALHPHYVLHPARSLELQWPLLLDGLHHLDRHFRALAPWPAGVPWVAPALAALAAWRRDVPAALAAAAVGVLVPLSLSAVAVHDADGSVTFSHARMYLPLPYAWAFLALAVAGRSPLSGHSRPRLALAAAGALLALAAARQWRLEARVDALMASQRFFVVPPVRTAEVLAECARLEAWVERTGAPLVVHLRDRRRAYACEALMSRGGRTLFPAYDRRTWRVEEEARTPRGRVLFAEVFPGFCQRARPLVSRCEEVDAQLGLALVELPPAPPLVLVRALGLRVRPL